MFTIFDTSLGKSVGRILYRGYSRLRPSGSRWLHVSLVLILLGITCQELVELITEYLEGSLDNDMRARFDQHLAACPGCSDYLEQMRQTIRATGRLREESLEPGATEALLDVFRDWKQGQ